MTVPRIVVCWKWVSLDGEREADPRWAGVSAADEAALEIALQLAERCTWTPTPGEPPPVTVVCVGPPAADEVLRDALAAGATDVVRVDAADHLDSRTVAAALCEIVADAELVLCGDYSIDRGTGSVPVFLAAERGLAQALGVVAIDIDRSSSGSSDDTPTPLRVTRRLDGGRREVLDVGLPAMVSVEGAVARLRRAPLAAELAARRADIPTVPGPQGIPRDAEVHPFRPRPRLLPAPSGDSLDRVRQLLDVGGDEVHAELVTLDPPEAAARIVTQLREWAYLPGPDAG